jgi:hypothetical protein
MKHYKQSEKMPFWMELLMFIWGLAYLIIGLALWYYVLFVDRAEPLIVIFAIIIGSVLIWTSIKGLIDLFKE